MSVNSDGPRETGARLGAETSSDGNALKYYELWLQGLHPTDKPIDPELLIRGGECFLERQRELQAMLSPQDAAAFAIEAALNAEDDEIA